MDVTILHRANEDFAGCLTEASHADLAGSAADHGGLEVYANLLLDQQRTGELIGAALPGGASLELPPPCSFVTAGGFGDFLAGRFRSRAGVVEQAFAERTDVDTVYSEHTWAVLAAGRQMAQVLGLA